MKKLPAIYKLLLISVFVGNIVSIDADDNIRLSECRAPISKTSLSENIALNCLEQKELLDSEVAEWNFQLALMKRNKRLLAEAEVYFLKALDKSTQVTYQLEYAVNFEWQEKLLKAQSIYESILQKEEKNIYARYGLARVKSWLGEIEFAKQRYIELLDENPADITALNGLAYVYRLDKQYANSIRQYKATLALQKDNVVAINALDELKSLNKHQFNYTVNKTIKQKEIGSSVQVFSHQMQLRSELSYKLTALHSLYYQSSQIDDTRLSQNGLINEADDNYRIESIWIYKNREKQYLAGFDLKKLFNRSHDLQLTLQRDVTLTPNSRWFVGLKPRFREEEENGGLVYAGYFKKLSDRLGMQVQGFYDVSFKEKNSQALAINLFQQTQSGFNATYGYSYAKNKTGNIDTIFTNMNYQATDTLNLTAGFIRNLDTSEQEIRFGFSLHFQ